ncbi:MAG TPA: hypothetical protein VHY91_27235 [Pirellulales bacterium]|jgi:hypothetical protein|nr:hypothetical protein [Pirellulales bacterium]
MPLPLCANDKTVPGTVSPKRFLAPFSRFLACGAIIALVWLGALPLLGRQPAIRHHVERNQSLGIDPSAKFYTELPGMPDFFDRTDTARRQHAATFGS